MRRMARPSAGAWSILTVAVLLAACRTSERGGTLADAASTEVRDGAGDPGVMAADVPTDVARDLPGDQPIDVGTPDVGGGDAGGGAACGGMTCGPNEVCLISTVAGGVPGSGVSTSYQCRPRPGGCPAELDCNCARSLCPVPVACACRVPAMTSATIQCDCFAP
jgi:hypothetical protein